MPVYVAKDYDGYPIDVVLTQSEQLAHAYWHGKGVVAHSVSILSDNDLADPIKIRTRLVFCLYSRPEKQRSHRLV